MRFRLIIWADEATAGSEGEFKLVAKRVGAIFLALARSRACDHSRDRALVRDRSLARSLTRAHSLVRALTRARALELELALAHGLDRSLAYQLQKTKIFKAVDYGELIDSLEALQPKKIPDNNQPLEVRRAFADRISQLWYDALNLNPDFLNLSESESNTLKNYLYANELIVRCKESAVRVTESVWAGIEERMLKVEE
jgi:hypothetical protein